MSLGLAATIFLFFLLSCQLVNAQQTLQDCAILVTSESDNGSPVELLFNRVDGDYIFTDDLEFLDTGILIGLQIAPNSSVLTMVQTDYFLSIADISIDGFSNIRKIPDSEQVALRNRAWSDDGSRILLHNIYDNRNNRLIVYDLNKNQYYRPTDLSEVFYPTWSPDNHTLAFVAYDTYLDQETLRQKVLDYALYVTEFDGTPIRTIPILEREFARFQWLSASELAVTTCAGNNCDLNIYDIGQNTQTSIELGAFLLEGRISSIDRFLLTSIDGQNLYLLNTRNSEMVQISDVDYLISRSVISSDERYLAYRADLNGEYKLFVTELSNRENVYSLDLDGEHPESLVGNSFLTLPYTRDFYSVFDDWHPSDDRLLFEDNNVIYIYDAETNSSEVANPSTPNIDYGSPRWVC